ncbi:hypothetical protein UlMin_045637 [Ulmus minor]
MYSAEYDCFFNEVGKGNWTTAREFLKLHPEAVRVTSSTCNRTALHVAVSFGHLHIVEELVKLMTPQDLEIKENGLLHTAFEIAVEKGNMGMAKCMVEKNKNLLCITDHSDMIPIASVVHSGQKRMARYLYPLTLQQGVLFSHNGKHGAALIIKSIENSMFDIVFDLIKRCPHLIIAKRKSELNSVTLISNHPALFPSGYQLKFWQQWIYSCNHEYSHKYRRSWTHPSPINTSYNSIFKVHTQLSESKMFSLMITCIYHIYEVKAVHTHSVELLNCMCKVIETLDENQIREVEMSNAIVQAASLGIVEFVTNISKAIPKAMWDANLARIIFESAIRNREAKVFSLIYGLDNKQTITDMHNSNRDTLLHVTGYIANSRKLNIIAGVALQMQREMQWYKEVEKITPEGVRRNLNRNIKRASQVFTETHKDLKIAGERWMKNTSSSCTVVGALIFTIMFTATFTLPGGNKQDTGFPMFLDEKLFKVFIISDAISLFSSTTSVLTFLGVLTSRYAEEDFLTYLPTKMMLGLSTLFISIAAMMTAFCAVIALLFQSQIWIVVPTILLAIIPVTLFVGLQFPLLVEIFLSTYGPSIFDRNVGNWLA